MQENPFLYAQLSLQVVYCEKCLDILKLYDTCFNSPACEKL